MAKVNRKRDKSRKGPSPVRAGNGHQTEAGLDPPDLRAIQGNLAHALSLVVVCQRSLAAQALAEAGDEDETLCEAIRLLRSVHHELDIAAGEFDS